MPMDSDAHLALVWCNDHRERAGWPLLEAWPKWKGCICPIEQALSLHPLASEVRVTPEHAWFKGGRGLLRVDLPPVLRAFMEKLDAGAYADLVEGPSSPCPREDTHTARCPDGVTAQLARRRQAA